MGDHDGGLARADGGIDADAAAASEQLAAIERPDASPDRYAFGDLPLEPVRPGTAVLVVSPAAVDDASRGMLAAGNPDEATSPDSGCGSATSRTTCSTSFRARPTRTRPGCGRVWTP